MKKKKIIAAIIALVAVFVVALGVESSFSKEKIDFVGEAENIEYYFEKMYLYNTMQDEFDATANLLDINTRAVALNENEKIQFKLPHKPIRIYELAANEKGDRIKVDYDKASRLYTLSDLQSSEVSEYNIVADYGIRKNVYTFKVYNKTYIENKFSQISAEGLCKSKHDKIAVNEAVSVKTRKDEYQLDSMDFRFIVNNNGNESLQCSMFKIEKMLGYTWYSVDENDISYNAKFWEESKQRMSPVVGKNGATTVKMPTSLGVLFELGIGNGLGSGTYRIVVPYICNGNTEYAISNPFTLGFVPSQTK